MDGWMLLMVGTTSRLTVLDLLRYDAVLYYLILIWMHGWMDGWVFLILGLTKCLICS